MNVDRVSQNLASGAYGRRTNRAGDVGSSPGSSSLDRAGGGSKPASDGLLLSEEARAIARVEAVVRAAPDVREELVADLHDKVQQGTYQVDDAQVARRLLETRG